MEDIKKMLKKRQEQLLKLKKEKERALMNAPEGMLRVCRHGNRVQYYLRKDPKDFSGVYIRGKDVSLAQKLAQKDYDKKILNTVEKELNAIDKYFMGYPEINAEQVYDKLHQDRKKLIKPIQLPEDEFVEKWRSVKYDGKVFRDGGPEIYTAREERVRSKSELIIADMLNNENIPYRYECPIHLANIGTVYPDFTVLNVRLRKEFYWEHMGMMDEPEYVEKALQKIACYEQTGIFPGESLILTYETKLSPINPKIVNLMIQKYLK